MLDLTAAEPRISAELYEELCDALGSAEDLLDRVRRTASDAQLERGRSERELAATRKKVRRLQDRLAVARVARDEQPGEGSRWQSERGRGRLPARRDDGSLAHLIVRVEPNRELLVELASLADELAGPLIEMMPRALAGTRSDPARALITHALMLDAATVSRAGVGLRRRGRLIGRLGFLARSKP